jgi:hypothetical protein
MTTSRTGPGPILRRNFKALGLAFEMNDQYYVEIDGKTAGPFLLDHVAKLYRAGTISDHTIYTMPDAVEWMQVRLLVPLFPSILPPPPPAHVLAASVHTISLASKPIANKGDWFCTQCHTVCRPKYVTQGSFVLEVFLWLLFLIPGLIYSIWRITSKLRCCPSCQSTSIVRANSPLAREFVALR